MHPRRAFLVALSFLSLTRGTDAQSTASELDAGPLFQEFKLTLQPGRRTEAVGPFYYSEQIDSERGWAIPPLLSYREDSETDFAELDFAYPFLTWDRFGEEYRFQIFQVFSFAGGRTQDDDLKRRFTLFPFYFQQRAPDPEDNYTALIPFYGRLKNRFFRDEVRFVLMPLYVQSRKRDVVTDNYVYPFFHLRRGNELSGWQFWPLIGKEHKNLTYRTNSFGETEPIAGHDKFFLLWPFHFNNRLGLGTTNLESQKVLLPFYSRQSSATRESTSYLWPFGYTYTEDREKKYREWGMPWPLIVFSRGEGKTANRVWPLFGQARNPILQSDFYLWPLYKYNRAQADPLDRERTRILFFLYSDLKEKNTTTGTALERTDLWPLFTARRDHSGNERLQLLAPLEPLLPNNKSIERNYSHVWSVWRSEKNRSTGARSQSFLWNLYRFEATPHSKKCSLFFGLFRYQSAPEGKRWRVLFIPFGKKSQPPELPPAAGDPSQ